MYDFNREEIQEAFQILYKALQKIMKQFREAWSTIYKAAEYHLKTLKYLESKEYVNQRKKVTTINFTRPIIRHQVLDRKPKHLIKKIIY